MVLWEITLATAYFLGLKRTYRLALRIQRRLISSKYPKIRQFAHRRSRTIFDVALKVHYKIQDRDIEVGRNLGNLILRWLDRFKPSAHIRGPPPEKPSPRSSSTITSTEKPMKTRSNNETTKTQEPGRHLFTVRENSSTGISVMRVQKPLWSMTQHRHICLPRPGGVFRKDVMEWMQRR